MRRCQGRTWSSLRTPFSAHSIGSRSLRAKASTETGDAWLLDPADRLAARLAREGKNEPIHIEETDTTFAVGWKGRYRIEGAAFVYSDHDTGRVTTILRYPIDELNQTA